MFQREFHQTVIALQVEFEADVLAVGFDRQRADADGFGDFLAGFVFGDQFEHLAFGGRKSGQPLRGRRGGLAALGNQKRGERRTDVMLPGGNGSDGADDVGGGGCPW